MNIQRAGIFLGVLSVFLYGYTVPGIALNLFLGVFVLLLAAVVISLSREPLLLHRGVLIGLIIVLSIGVIGVLLGRGTVTSYFIQGVALLVVTLSSSIVIAGSHSDPTKIFATYLELSFFFALVAIFESVLGLMGLYLEFLTPRVEYTLLNFHRVSGLALEPSFYCLVMAPSVVAILISTLLGRPCMRPAKSLIIVMSYILTFSSVGIFVLSLVLIFFLFRRSSFSSLVVKTTLIVGVLGVISVIPQISTRIVDTYSVFTSSNIENVNLSTLTLYKNFVVTVNSAIDQPLVGAGLGGHEYNYQKYTPGFLVSEGSDLNRKDANSLLLRLISEFGIPFTVLFYLMIVLYWTGFPDRQDPAPIFWKKLTSTAILALIIANSLRNGNYINLGFPFFLVLYFSTYRSLKFGDPPRISIRTAAPAAKML